MEYLIFTVGTFAVVILIILGVTIPMFKRHRKATGGIVNYDAAMRKFVYKINLRCDEFVELLTDGSDGCIDVDIDALSCTVDPGGSVIRFSEYGADKEYRFRIQEYDGFSVLRLEQVALLGMQSSIPYKLNPFMVHKLQAEIVPFSEYGF